MSKFDLQASILAMSAEPPVLDDSSDDELHDDRGRGGARRVAYGHNDDSDDSDDDDDYDHDDYDHDDYDHDDYDHDDHDDLVDDSQEFSAHDSDENYSDDGDYDRRRAAEVDRRHRAPKFSDDDDDAGVPSKNYASPGPSGVRRRRPRAVRDNTDEDEAGAVAPAAGGNAAKFTAILVLLLTLVLFIYFQPGGRLVGQKALPGGDADGNALQTP